MGLSFGSACVPAAVRVPINICVINGSTDPPAQRVNQSDATVFEAGGAACCRRRPVSGVDSVGRRCFAVQPPVEVGRCRMEVGIVCNTTVALQVCRAN